MHPISITRTINGHADKHRKTDECSPSICDSFDQLFHQLPMTATKTEGEREPQHSGSFRLPLIICGVRFDLWMLINQRFDELQH